MQATAVCKACVRYIYDGATWRRREEWTALHEV